MATAVIRKRFRAPQASGTRDKLSEKIYKVLKRDIVRGVHAPGQALTEKDLARRYRSSRTPVREAAL
ncbi:MAG TPA: GntR family transcriptional regulator, partial [Terriglobales bacterium]|nr:GntR family transcriptional regulator [Terriglobales bacterium]